MAFTSFESLKDDLVVLYMAYQMHTHHNDSKSEDVPTLISTHIFNVHYLDRCECLHDCMDAHCYRYDSTRLTQLEIWPWTFDNNRISLVTFLSDAIVYRAFSGFTFGIPDAVMGLTFLAAGGCMPEGISSVLMIRKNEGGVGVSNSLGANSLAILMSLGVPWLIKNILHQSTPGKQSIPLNPYSTEYNILLLLFAVIALYIILTIAKYRLKRTVGVVLMSVYVVCITIGILLEMNVFFPGICS